MEDYVRELDIELKKLEKEIAETREPMNPEESLEEWEKSYNKRKKEIERKVDECFERFDERKRREEQKKEERKKKLSYKIPMFILKIFLFLLIIGFGMIAGIYYLIVALIISWIIGSVFIKL